MTCVLDHQESRPGYKQGDFRVTVGRAESVVPATQHEAIARVGTKHGGLVRAIAEGQRLTLKNVGSEVKTHGKNLVEELAIVLMSGAEVIGHHLLDQNRAKQTGPRSRDLARSHSAALRRVRAVIGVQKSKSQHPLGRLPCYRHGNDAPHRQSGQGEAIEGHLREDVHCQVLNR
jgi:hypothetical protein